MRVSPIAPNEGGHVLNHRGILLAFALVVSLGVACAVAIPYFYWPLPDPAVADRDGLFHWLVARDLGLEPVETRLVLAQRLEEEFRTGIDWEETAAQLDSPQRQRVWDNIVLLLEPWFMDKRDRYFELAGAERSAYLDELLDTFAAWRGVDLLRDPQAADDGSSTTDHGLLGVLVEQMDHWKEGAELPQRERTDRFFLAIQSRWLMRSLKQYASGSAKE